MGAEGDRRQGLGRARLGIVKIDLVDAGNDGMHDERISGCRPLGIDDPGLGHLDGRCSGRREVETVTPGLRPGNTGGSAVDLNQQPSRARLHGEVPLTGSSLKATVIGAPNTPDSELSARVSCVTVNSGATAAESVATMIDAGPVHPTAQGLVT